MIELAQSEWNIPIVIVHKTNGTLLLCSDYRRLHAATIPDTFSQPHMNDFIDSLGMVRISTALDALRGYRHAPIKDEDQNKATITSHLDTFRYPRMQFNLRIYESSDS